MTRVLIAIALAVLWAAITGTFTLPNLLFGLVLALIALMLLRDRHESPRLVAKTWRVLALTGVFIYELFLSAFKVAWLVVTPDMKRRLAPGFIAFPLTARSDAEITLLANLITLTPGTLSVDVSDDRSTLYIHAITVDDKQALIADIARSFEARVIEMFR
jgi:multicomponent Na+:H+ antiporter subunit E